MSNARKRTVKEGARAQMRLMERGAKGADGEVLRCECGGELDAYDLLRETERRRLLLCCRRTACGNSAVKSAKILRADLKEDQPLEGGTEG